MNFDCFSILLYFREGAAVTLLLKLLILKKALNPFNGVTPHLLSEAIHPPSSRSKEPFNSLTPPSSSP